MFEDATFHSRGILPSQTPKWMLATLALNLTTLTAIIVLPLIHPESLPHILLNRTLFDPAPPPAATQQPHRVARPLNVRTISLRDPFIAPRLIPSSIATTPDAPPAISDPNLMGSSVSGADGPPAVLFHSDPPSPVKPPQVQSTPIHLSIGVTEGLAISRSKPVYPTLAIVTHTSGTVVLAATISTSGAIKDLRVVSGNPMLTSAALAAVQNWRYRPYLLNNQPVEVQTTINVVFSLGSR